MTISPSNQSHLFLLARTLEFITKTEDNPEFKAQKLADARALRKRALLKGAAQVELDPALGRPNADGP